MSKARDLTGQRFNNWLVIEKDIIKSKASKRSYWICECQGCEEKTRKSILQDNLVGNKSKSCGCWNKKVLQSRHNDYIGKKFDKLIVLEQTDERSIDGTIIWLCKCECGNIT